MFVAFLFACIELGRWSFLLGLGELFRRNRRFRERRVEVFPSADGGLRRAGTLSLHPARGTRPLTLFLSSPVFIG